MKTRIVIIDDHRLFREGVKRILQFEEQFEVVAEGADGSEALALVEKYRPDIVIMDINMPHTNGVEATRQLIDTYPNTKVVVLRCRGCFCRPLIAAALHIRGALISATANILHASPALLFRFHRKRCADIL